jgi:hypothetical protein
MLNSLGVRKFVDEFLDEWPIAFMDDYTAKEWLSERSRNGTAVCQPVKTELAPLP